MKTKFSLLALLLCLCQLASAQTADTATFYRHHIGVNTRVVLDKLVDPASQMPLQLMYKYQLSSRTALRLSVEGMYTKSDSSRSYIDRLDEVTHYTYGGGLGYERQRPLGKVLMVYYGADAFYRRQGKNTEVVNKFIEPTPNQDLMEVRASDNHANTTIGLGPFLGLRANIGKRLYLSTETSIQLKREKKTQDFHSTSTRYHSEGAATGSSYADYTVYRNGISYLPFNGLSIQYTF